LSNFGERLRTLRQDRNWSQGHVAEACNISVNFLRHVEKSRRIPNIELLVTLCNLFDVSPVHLLQDTLTDAKSKDDKQEILRILEKLSPDMLNYVRDMCGTVEQHFTDVTN